MQQPNDAASSRARKDEVTPSVRAALRAPDVLSDTRLYMENADKVTAAVTGPSRSA